MSKYECKKNEYSGPKEKSENEQWSTNNDNEEKKNASSKGNKRRTEMEV